MDKNFSLLHPFDPEKARAGEAICTNDGMFRQFIAGPDDSGYFCVKTDEGEFTVGRPSHYRMAPLSWLEGRPVYKNATAYGTVSGEKFTALTADTWLCDETLVRFGLDNKGLTWTKPSHKTVKRTVTYMAYNDNYKCLQWRREDATTLAGWTRLPEFDLSREIEEEEKP